MKHKSKKRTRKYIKKLRKSKKRTRKYNKSNKIKYKKRMNYKSAKKRFKTRRYKRNARKHYKKGGAPTLEQLNQKLIRKNKDLDFFIRGGIETYAINQEIQELKEQIEAKELEAAIEAVEAAIEAEGAERAAAAGPPTHEQQPGAAGGPGPREQQLGEAGGPDPREQRLGEAVAGLGAAEVEVDPHEGQSLHNSEATLVYTDPIGGGKLYLGGVTPGTDKNFLKSIKTIITIMVDPPLPPAERIDSSNREFNGQPYKLYITYSDGKSQERWIIPINDDDDGRLTSYFKLFSDLINTTINQMGKNVLVHCSSGVSRSSTIVIAYLMNKQGMTLRDAYRYVYERRNIILPGIGFFRELMALDLKLYASNSMGLKEYYAYSVQKSVKEMYQKDVSYEDCFSEIGKTGYDEDTEILQAIENISKKYPE